MLYWTELWRHQTMYIFSVKIRKNIYKFDVQVTFDLYSHFRCLQVRSFIPNKITFTKYCLTQWISKLPGSFEIKAVLGKHFAGLAGIVNATVYKTEPIFTGQIMLIFNTVYIYIYIYIYTYTYTYIYIYT